MRLATSAAAWALALALVGCGTPAPKEQYFTLSSPNPGVAPALEDSPAVFVGPIAIPDAVDRDQMVLRTGPNQVDVSDRYRWAEPLRGGIARVVADTLARELGTSRVATSRPAEGASDYRVAIEVQRFDATPGEGATVEALWTVHGAKAGAPRTGHTLARESASTRDPGALAAALSRALARLGHDIAREIRAPRPAAQ